jgi:phosphatidylglycerophosphate synthase
MKHLRWIISLILFLVATQSARELHGWHGFWIASVLMSAFGIINFFDGYFARQRELEEKLGQWKAANGVAMQDARPRWDL